ncbi:MAG: outer membrane protein assembly factor BamD [Byssovorax sp.]
MRSRFAPKLTTAALGLAVGVVVSAGALGCDSFEIGAKHATLTYTDDARAAYEEAMSSFRSRDWEDARALLAEVRRLFPYTRYARLAELRLADADFEQEKFSDAISGYREFVQNHKNDPDVEYSRYRLTKALFSDIDDTILLPPAEERDQATTTEAYKELRNFQREFPKSRYRGDVTYMLDVVTGRMARHELYVARYSLKGDNFDAAVARIDYVLKTYPGTSLTAEALVLKGETLMKMKRLADARAVFERVVKELKGPFLTTAQRFLDEIKDLEAHQRPAAAPAKQ